MSELCWILLVCRILFTDDAGSNAGFVHYLCRILLCRILSTDDAGYAAGSDTELMPVLMPVLMPENIYILPDNIY